MKIRLIIYYIQEQKLKKLIENVRMTKFQADQQIFFFLFLTLLINVS